jgi:hypothetical protein
MPSPITKPGHPDDPPYIYGGWQSRRLSTSLGRIGPCGREAHGYVPAPTNQSGGIGCRVVAAGISSIRGRIYAGRGT